MTEKKRRKLVSLVRVYCADTVCNIAILENQRVRSRFFYDIKKKYRTKSKWCIFQL